jgi:predicted integral membrane protein DUF2269
MELTAADFALFLHIFFVIAGLCLAAVLHAGLLLLRAATDVAAIRAWPRVVRALEVALPLTALLILLTGSWLLHLSNGEFSWEQGWVTASLVGLLCAETAGAVAGPRSAALRRAINEAPDGPVGADLRRRILDPVLWCILHGGTAIFLAVVFVMVVKPAGLWSAVVIAAVGLLGALSGFPFSRPTRTGRRTSAAGHVAGHGEVGTATHRRARDPDT